MFGLPDGVSACLFDMDGVVTQTATARAAVFGDAQAGVAAGHAGHFALVVGVDRVGQAAEHGADIVVTELSEFLDRNGGTR
jgi:beta-phosphoglucomutase-like phosphatase (HAD superfamily)